MGFIGEQFSIPNEVTGIVLQVGNGIDKISVWLRHGNDQSVIKQIKTDLIKMTGLTHDIKTSFQLFHKD